MEPSVNVTDSTVYATVHILSHRHASTNFLRFFSPITPGEPPRLAQSRPPRLQTIRRERWSQDYNISCLVHVRRNEWQSIRSIGLLSSACLEQTCDETNKADAVPSSNSECPSWFTGHFACVVVVVMMMMVQLARVSRCARPSSIPPGHENTTVGTKSVPLCPSNSEGRS